MHSAQTAHTLRFERRFRGYPHRAHGGYVCGVLGEVVARDVSVRFRRPVPVEVDLSVDDDGGGAVSVADPGGVCAVASPLYVPLDVVVPPVPSYEEAEAASARFLDRASQVYDECLVCGTGRAEGDGVRLFAGVVDAAGGVVAAPWVPGPGHGDPSDPARAADRWVAAVLDCPGGYAAHLAVPVRSGATLVTAEMAVTTLGRALVGEPHVVVGWAVRARRLLYECATALVDSAGEVLAVARTKWMPTAVEVSSRT